MQLRDKLTLGVGLLVVGRDEGDDVGLAVVGLAVVGRGDGGVVSATSIGSTISF